MLDKQDLRKADIITGIIFCIFGLFIVSQATDMPMKDSWGGVQNVWYVSPALFPLCIGITITILGFILAIKAVSEIGIIPFLELVKSTFSRKGIDFLTSDGSFRFYMVCSLFIFFVFLYISRVDFILNSILFLIVFVTAFYFENPLILKKSFIFYSVGSLFYLALVLTGTTTLLEQGLVNFSDYYSLLFIILYTLYILQLTKNKPDLRKKFHTAIIVAVVTAFALGTVFKYFLLVPLMHEGLVIEFMDNIRYMEF